MASCSSFKNNLYQPFSNNSTTQSIADSQKQNFVPVPNTALIAHFDGKMLPDCTGNFADRMLIIVSGLNVEKLLAIPILPASTGELIGNAVVETLREWQGVPEYLAGLCFDTTSANMGIHTGTITVIQKAFDKRPLFLACRHHMLEIVSAAIFDRFFKSSGPQIGIFSRSEEQWPFMNQADFEPMVTVSEQSPSAASQSDLPNDELQWLQQTSSGIVVFLHDLLTSKAQPRQDYLEFIKLVLIVLNKADLVTDGNAEAHVSPPGAYHRARWMAKGIY